jgi:predicted phosphodiesterase
MTCKENETLYNIVGKVLCVNPGKKCYPGYTNILAACTKKKERKYKFSTQNN